MFSKGLLCLLFAACAFAQDYADDQAAREQQLAPNYARQSYNPDIYETARAEPYDFGFQSTDEFGTIMNRQEASDNNGAVRGSYGYTDPFGVFRHVDYVADEYGFRAEVKSNEPGMGTQSPANVQIYAEPPPAGVIVERPYYHPHHLGQGGQGGQSGQASGQQPSRRNPSSSASNSANRQVRPVSSGARLGSSTSGSRSVLYPYVQPQQNAFASNALSNSQYSSSSSSQYPSTVSSQYAANAAAASSSSSTGSQYSTGTAYQASAASVYPARNPYGSQGYATLTASQYGSERASAASAPQPIVPKPYDGPTYKVGNPHVTEFVRADKEKSATYLLPTVVAAGNAPTTLVKHIHTYPAAPAA
ncbi:cuticle protein 16.8 [Trichonephila inaurata madagascariensis]|uniref:Cuticle protein 16.8 n=1 Tax=Trichonephila inaurata madagascariensis TaxID=2747483 RepID=A0A8X6Y8A5_9ARAC|nr:cuticle protein 16.8 [Trichonephila inaurata madagascariensis]